MTGQSVSDLTRVVPILGMHRSGTSMLAGALQQLGLELGSPLLTILRGKQSERVSHYRSTLRARLQNSAPCDGQRFTRGFEAACGAMMNSTFQLSNLCSSCGDSKTFWKEGRLFYECHCHGNGSIKKHALLRRWILSGRLLSHSR